MEFKFSTIVYALLILICSGCSGYEHSLPGYIEGEYTYVSSNITGTLLDLHVKRGQQVVKNNLLFTLDPEPEKAKVETIQANIADLEAQLAFSKVQLARQKELYLKKFTSKESLDQAQTDYDSKLQQIASNHAQLIQSKWALDQKTQYAPIGGVVFDTFYRVGETVEANHPVLAILAPKNIRVLFYVPERLLSQIRIGQTVSFTCDNCKNVTKAIISYISPEAEYTPPVIYSKDTRNKLAYLIRADMPEDIAKNFNPGQPIEVSLHP